MVLRNLNEAFRLFRWLDVLLVCKLSREQASFLNRFLVLAVKAFEVSARGFQFLLGFWLLIKFAGKLKSRQCHVLLVFSLALVFLLHLPNEPAGVTCAPKQLLFVKYLASLQALI